MRIGINARYLQNIHSGIQNRLMHLLLNLKKIDKENEYILFFGSDNSVPADILEKGFEQDIASMPTGNQFLKILWEHLYLPNSIAKNNIELFHETSFVAPFIRKCPTVVTVHDLAFLYFPHCYTRRTLLYLKSLLPGSLRRSDMIIAVSKNAKEDIINHYAVPDRKVQVIYAGHDRAFRVFKDEIDRERVKRVAEKYKIKKDFIFSAARITPRKNFVRLIRAFKMLKDRRKMDGQLVITGGEGWLSEDVFREVSLCKLEDDVIFCGYVPKEDLVCFYNAASIFAYPSLYEGFGMPVLEAMSCACPVVASNISSIPEVCGDAAVLVDPTDVEEMTDALDRMYNDTGGIRRKLIEKGLERIKNFSWEKAAEETLEVYAKVGSKT